MEIDSGLLLKQRNRQEELCIEEIKELLNNSEVIKGVLQGNFQLDKFTGVRKLSFQLLEISEIPFVFLLSEAQELLQQLIDATEIKEGYSLTKEANTVLACHQANLILLMIRSGKKALAEKGVQWILKYQTTQRGEHCSWHGCDLFERFGGCIGKTPCYDGLVKSMKALSEYKRAFGATKDIEEKLANGLKYILEHQVIYHAQSQEILYPDLVKLFYPYPYPYRTNIIEALKLLKDEGYWDDKRLEAAKKMLLQKRTKDGYKVDKVFMKSSWYPFDEPKKIGLWLTDEIDQLFL